MGHLYLTQPFFGVPPRVEVRQPATHADEHKVSIYLGEYGEAWVSLDVEEARVLGLQLNAAVARIESNGELEHPSTSGPPRIKD